MSYNPLLFPTLILGAIAFAVSAIMGRRVRRRLLFVVFATALSIPGLLFVLYYTHLFDKAVWFYNFRSAHLTELTAAGLGFLPGLIYAWSEPETFLEKAVLPLLLFFMLFVPFCKPILDSLDVNKLHDSCDGEVCLQSTFSTCGPASAATLMRHFGGNGSEREFAEAAFTSRGGTEIWYLARALRARNIDATFLVQSPGDRTLPSPSIAGVVLDGGSGHFIVILDNSPAQITIADPLKGKLVIPKSELMRQYHFTGLFLVAQTRPLRV